MDLEEYLKKYEAGGNHSPQRFLKHLLNRLYYLQYYSPSSSTLLIAINAMVIHPYMDYYYIIINKGKSNHIYVHWAKNRREKHTLLSTTSQWPFFQLNKFSFRVEKPFIITLN